MGPSIFCYINRLQSQLASLIEIGTKRDDLVKVHLPLMTNGEIAAVIVVYRLLRVSSDKLLIINLITLQQFEASQINFSIEISAICSNSVP